MKRIFLHLWLTFRDQLEHTRDHLQRNWQIAEKKGEEQFKNFQFWKKRRPPRK